MHAATKLEGASSHRIGNSGGSGGGRAGFLADAPISRKAAGWQLAAEWGPHKRSWGLQMHATRPVKRVDPFGGSTQSLAFTSRLPSKPSRFVGSWVDPSWRALTMAACNSPVD
mmetsp:Transcript_26370/g.78300  ORF Transcript_26370/g.78300 Transcript_26370/m.78300 type:complete len:113 (+) Transcript_26370:2763-3101(+)|eukprot:363062-Chlamydomonas_euryale.AAC.3